MNEEPKKITREELHSLVWTKPFVRLAVELGYSYPELVRICTKLRIPRPSGGYWYRLAHGSAEPPLQLPPAASGTQTEIQLGSGRKASQLSPVEDAAEAKPNTTEAVEEPVPKQEQPKHAAPTQAKTNDEENRQSEVAADKRAKFVVSDDLSKAHPLVKAAYQALKSKDVYFHNGTVRPRAECLLSVAVSADQVKRALCIMNAIITKGVIDQGGRWERGPESRNLHFVMGKQPASFGIQEILKRHKLEFTEEERLEPAFQWRTKHEWKGSGFLRFKIYHDEYVSERIWEETNKRKLEDMIGEIVSALANVETVAKENRAAEVERQAQAAEEQRRSALEWRQAREEEQRRKNLEEASQQWERARQLRRFIRACERTLRDGATELPTESKAAQWMSWARQHADRIDPLVAGYLARLRSTVSNNAMTDSSS